MSNKKRLSKINWIWLIVLITISATITIFVIWFPDIALNIWIFLEPWIWLIFTIIGIILTYKILTLAINRYAKKHEKFPKDAANGLILILRIAVIFALLFVILPAVNIPSEYLMNISTILATAVGFASTIAVSNIVAGIYMIMARPYKIGDFINVDGAIEGVVKEVGLNYTKLLDADEVIYQIPNNKLFSSNIVNFSLEPSKKKKERATLDHKTISFLSDALLEKKIVRYIFDIELALDLDSDETLKILEEICDRWEPKFGYRPQYFIHQISWRLIIRWALFGNNPQVIMNNSTPFIEDIWLSAYKYKEELK